MKNALVRKSSVIPVLFILISHFAYAGLSGGLHPHTAHTGYVQNRGQIKNQYHQPNPAVLYLLNMPGMNIQLRQTGFSYDTYTLHSSGSDNTNPPAYQFHRVDVELLNCNPQATLVPEGAMSSYFNYFGSNPTANTIAKVPHYGQVSYRNIYPGIDLTFSLVNGQPKYDFIVHPGGHVSAIQLQYKGMDRLEQLSPGELGITVTQGRFTDAIPLSYERETERKVNVYYVPGSNNTVRLVAGNYNPGNTLVIDPVPVLLWGTYYGGGNMDYGLGVAVENNGKIAITGQTGSAGNIATTGAYQTTYTAGWECYVAKLSADGKQLLWGSYYDGTNEGRSIAVDASGNVLVTGTTGNTAINLSTTGAHQTTPGGANDAFIAKFSADGTQLLWGTYLGGTLNDAGQSITTDAQNNVLVTGYARSLNGIATSGAYKTTNTSTSPYFNAFVAKFSPTGQLLWGTYYGGTVSDQGTAIITDANNDVYISGITQSPGTATTGAHQTTLLGSANTFIAKISNNGAQLLWSTYYGGGAYDTVNYPYANTYNSGIALDKNGNILVTGYTTATDGIATAGAYSTVYNGGQDVYIAQFKPDGSQLLWGTYYGGSSAENGAGIAVDNTGHVLVTGVTTSANNIASAGAYQTNYKASNDTYLAKFSPDGTQLIWGTYFSVPYQDQASAIALDNTGNAVITGFSGGYAGDTDLSTPGSYQVGNNSYGDTYVAKFESGGCKVSAGSITALRDTVCAGTASGLAVSNSNAGLQWQSSLSSSNFININAATDTVYNAPVQQTTYFRTVASDGLCADTSAAFKLNVNPLPVAGVQAADTLICSGDSAQVCVTPAFSAYLWNTGSTANCIQAKNGGGYWLTVTDVNGCSAISGRSDISVYPVSPVSIILKGDSLISFNSTNYQWLLNGTAIPNATSFFYVPVQSGDYAVQIVDSNGCRVTSSPITFVYNSIHEAGGSSINIYPNPVLNTLYIDAEQVGQVEIYDLAGRRVYSKNFNLLNKVTVGLPFLQTGMYYVKVSAAGNNYVQKIIKQ